MEIVSLREAVSASRETVERLKKEYEMGEEEEKRVKDEIRETSMEDLIRLRLMFVIIVHEIQERMLELHDEEIMQ